MAFAFFDGGGRGTSPFEQVQFIQMQTYLWGGEGGLGVRVDGDGLKEGGVDFGGDGSIGLSASRTLLI